MRRIQEARKKRLIDNYFTIVESDVLKVIPFSVPYMKTLINDRVKLAKLAISEGWGRNKFLQAIAQMYNVRGWKEPHERLAKSNIFHMVKAYETDWRLNVSPDDPYLLKQKRSHHGHYEALNRDKVLQQKATYRQTHQTQIRQYRQTHRAQINEARRKREAFKRSSGLI